MPKQKNRRYRNAKISEHRLKRVVECFAANLTVKEAAQRTKLSEPAIASIYMRLRLKLKTNGMFTFDIAKETHRPGQAIWGKVNRGAPEQHKELHEIELISRIVAAHKFSYVEKLSPSDPQQWERLTKLYLSDRRLQRYNFIEVLPEGLTDRDGENQRPFDPMDVHMNSTVIINEKMADPNAAFFRYLWQLLLKSPLDASEKV
ncbi:hypothetical protein [Porphyrobacter sp. YT40]|uniref:hypothetical protein n=1 Tax=Porphyrobacter sp. YT40 TaxID=2547601 RepID=UPI0011440059|nr:hypothetical protein [Porphyrobacter sp. YT40]QDH35553.1 hypothetical protein E2E27_15275 [Porphyrobacter sp. YT40]